MDDLPAGSGSRGYRVNAMLGLGWLNATCDPM